MRLIPTIRLTLGAWLVALSLPVAATAIISVGALAQGPCAAESETNDQPDLAVAFGGAGWIIALGTGLRQGELLALRWEDVDLEAGRLRVRYSLANVDGELTLQEPKTDRSRRSLVLSEAVTVALRAHRTRQRMDRLAAGSRWVDSGHVFATMLGKPHHAATITRCFQDALDRAGLPRVRFHDLRHSAATFLLAQGFTLEDVKNLLGHSTIVLTSNTYGHVLEQRQHQVARGMDAVLGG